MDEETTEITKERATQALFTLATGTSSPDREREIVLRYFGLHESGPIARNFRDQVQRIAEEARASFFKPQSNVV